MKIVCIFYLIQMDTPLTVEEQAARVYYIYSIALDGTNIKDFECKRIELLAKKERPVLLYQPRLWFEDIIEPMKADILNDCAQLKQYLPASESIHDDIDSFRTKLLNHTNNDFESLVICVALLTCDDYFTKHLTHNEYYRGLIDQILIDHKRPMSKHFMQTITINNISITFNAWKWFHEDFNNW